MSNYPIGRVAIKNEETGEFAPVDARTCTEAVEAEDGRTAQDHLNDLKSHINNPLIHSTAYIKAMWQVTIPVSGWVLDAPMDADFPYYLDLPYEGILDTHNAEVTVDKESIQVAAACGLCPTMETLHNGLRFWTRELPEQEILCHMTLFGEGGISGGSVSGGIYPSVDVSAHAQTIASADTLGHVRIGDNITIDTDGRITPTGATLTTEQTATDEDIDAIIENVFGSNSDA